MTRVSIKPEVLRWARERAGLPSEALIKIRDFSRYEDWERGEAEPTLKQLEKLANKTHTPLGCFFLPKPPEDKLPIPDFRTVKGGKALRPSPDLLETVQTMQRRQGWMREYLIEQGQEPLHFVGSANINDDPEDVAPRIRETLGFSVDWAKHERTWTDALRRLREGIEDARILTAFNSIVGNNTHRNLDVDEFRGFVLVDEYAPSVFVNSADAKAAQMFTLVHELAHLWLGKTGVFNLRNLQPADNEVEIFCNRAAAEFLVPAETIREFWPNAEASDNPFQACARRFKVSPLVSARRALDLRLINRDRFFAFYNEYLEEQESRPKPKSKSGDFHATQRYRLGERFTRAVIRAAREGRLLYRDAFLLTGLSGGTFDKFADRMEGV